MLCTHWDPSVFTSVSQYSKTSKTSHFFLCFTHANNTKATVSYKNFEASHVQGFQKVQIHLKEMNFNTCHISL